MDALEKGLHPEVSPDKRVMAAQREFHDSDDSSSDNSLNTSMESIELIDQDGLAHRREPYSDKKLKTKFRSHFDLVNAKLQKVRVRQKQQKK